MVRCLNIVNRIGSKQNDIKFFKEYLPLDSKIIVEPFGGSFAVIKNFYIDSNKYTFHINDNDETLYYVYLHPEELIDMKSKLSKLYIEEYKNKEYNKEDNFLNAIHDMDIDNNLKEYILKSLVIRGKLFKPIKNTNYNEEELKILKTALITQLDYTVLLDQYKDNEDAFLFLDPPYLFSNNSGYDAQLQETDMTQIIINILEYIKVCKCKVMLIINKLNILSYLFKDYIKGEYLRTYQLTKKKSKHLIICNYDI
jgi:site-specific DNA-adenine methylase